MKKVFAMAFVVFILIFFQYSQQAIVNFDYDNESHISETPYVSVKTLHYMFYSPWKVNGAGSFVVTYDELKKDNLIGILRYNNGKYYSVSKINDDKYVFFLFYECENRLILEDGLLVNDFLIDKKAFKDRIMVGTHKDIVKKIDPNTYDGEVCTYHYFSDKSITEVKYENDIVKDITEWNNTYSVISYLLPQDLDLIIKK